MSTAGQAKAEECFVDSFANPDSLSDADLLKLHATNFILSVVNKCEKKEVVDTAIDSYVPITDLDTL